jgi:hypothetical protein
MQPRGDRRLAHAERPRGLAVAQTDQIDGDDRVPEVRGQRRNRRVEVVHLHPLLGCGGAAVRQDVSRVAQGHRLRPSRGRPPAADERVAQRAQQVADVILGGQKARLAEDLGAGLLEEFLRLLPGTAQPPGGAVEPIEVVAQVVWVELPPARVIGGLLSRSGRQAIRRGDPGLTWRG